MPIPVIVYSTPTCGSCRVVKEFLARRGVPYTERNAEDPGVLDDLNARAGQQIRAVPVVEAGSDILVGYDPMALDVLLRKIGY
jgi:glutaredoxin